MWAFFLLGILWCVALPLAACSWLQQRKPDFQCAALTSVEHAGELFAFVQGCKGISDTYSAFTDCLRPVIGSKWSQEVVDCFAIDAINGTVPRSVVRTSVSVPDGGSP